MTISAIDIDIHGSGITYTLTPAVPNAASFLSINSGSGDVAVSADLAPFEGQTVRYMVTGKPDMRAASHNRFKSAAVCLSALICLVDVHGDGMCIHWYN